MTKPESARYHTTNWKSYNAGLRLDRSGSAVIPIRKHGRFWKEDCPSARARNDILRASKRFGRANWKHGSGYHVQRRIDARMASQVRSNLWR